MVNWAYGQAKEQCNYGLKFCILVGTLFFTDFWGFLGQVLNVLPEREIQLTVYVWANFLLLPTICSPLRLPSLAFFFSHLCPHRVLTVNFDFAPKLPWHMWKARGQWTMALIGPETCWDCRSQPITCVSEEVKNEFRDILKVEKRKQLEQATRPLNYLLSQNLWYTEDGPWVCSSGTGYLVSTQVSALFWFHFTFVIWFGVCNPVCTFLWALGQFITKLAWTLNYASNFRKPHIIYQLGKEVEVIELLSYIILNFLSEYWHLPAVRVMYSLGRSNNREESMKSDESC